MIPRGIEGIFPDEVRLLEPLLYVTHVDLYVDIDIVGEGIMNQDRPSLHRLMHGEICRKLFVLHLDQSECLKAVSASTAATAATSSPM